MHDEIVGGEAVPAGVDATWMAGLGIDRARVRTEYTHMVEFALLSACLRQPMGVDEVSAVIDRRDFLEPVCASLWALMITARIECSAIDDDRLRQLFHDLADDDAERIIDRLRHPLVKPKSLLKFAKEIKRLARERAL